MKDSNLVSSNFDFRFKRELEGNGGEFGTGVFDGEPQEEVLQGLQDGLQHGRRTEERSPQDRRTPQELPWIHIPPQQVIEYI